MKITRRLRLDPIDRVTGHPTLAWWLGIGVVVVALFIVAVPLNSGLYGMHVAFAFGLSALQCGSLLLAPVRPGLAIAAFIISAAVMPSLSTTIYGSTTPWPWSVTSIIALSVLVGLLAFYVSWQHGLWAYILAIAASSGAITWQRLTPARLDMALINLIIATSIVGTFFLLVILIAQRQRIREQLLTAREITADEQSRRMLIEERQRIARELHDVVAHSMSLIQVQATTARYRLPELDASAATEFDEIGASARGAMIEMRRLLGVLRNGEDDPELHPLQGINDIPALVESASRAGVEIRLDDTSTIPENIAPSVHIAAFRITQEAISNAVRHAPGAPICVGISTVGGHVVVEIINSASDNSPGEASRGSGHGLVGMRERASLLNGSVSAHETRDGGYAVRAELPLHNHNSEETA